MEWQGRRGARPFVVGVVLAFAVVSAALGLGAAPAGAAVAAPAAPKAPTAVAGNGSATVKWSAPSANGSAVTGYVVTPVLGTVAQAAQAFTTTATTQVVTGLVNGNTYSFRVAAQNAVGAGPAATTPTVTIGVPAGPAFPGVTSGNGSATVTSWVAAPNGAAVTGYVVTPFAGTVALASRSFPGAGTSHLVTGLTNGTAYSFRVAAQNAYGIGPAATSATVVVGLPAAPTGASVQGGSSSATVKWSAPSGNGSAVTGYVVTPMLGTVALPAQAFASTATSQVVIGLANGSTYSFKVAAQNAIGTGPAATTATVTVGVPGGPPFPSAASATSSAKVSWWAAAANGSVVTGYVVTPFVGSVAQPARTFASTATTQVVTGLTNGTTYSFKVAGVNAVGSGPAATSAAIVVGAPLAPTKVAATAGVAGSRQVTVSWTAPAANASPITGYVVTPSRAGVVQPKVVTASAAPSVVVSDLITGSPYTFTVAATNASGTGVASAATAAVTPAPAPAGTPSAPTALTTLAGNGRVTLGWTAPSAGTSPITGYVVTPTVGGVAQPAVSFADPSTLELIEGLPNGIEVTFTVRATNASGTGPASAPTAAVVPVVPPAPSAGTIDVIGDSITAQSFWFRDAEWAAQGQPAYSDVLKDAYPGRQFQDIQATERDRILTSRRPATLVLALGTNNAIVDNGGWTTSDEVAFRSFLDLASPDACVVVVLPGYGSQASAAFKAQDDKARAYLAATAPTRPNTQVVDWGAVTSLHPDYLDTDGIHLDRLDTLPNQQANPTAANAFAAKIWEGVSQCPNNVSGSGGLGFSGLAHPYGVAVDPAGAVFVADSSHDRVVSLTSEGVQTTLGFSGLSSPVGVALDAAGTVYVADTGNDRIVSLTTAGVQATLPFTGLSYPAGVAIDGAGTVFVADTQSNRIATLTAGGVQATLPFSGLSYPVGVTVDAAGTVYVADTLDDRIVALGPGGIQTTLPFTGLDDPVGVAVDAAGTAFVADATNDRVVSLTTQGVQTTVAFDSLDTPVGVAIGPDGTVFVSDSGRGRVLALAP